MKTEKDFEKWIHKQIRFYLPFLGLQIQRIKVEKKINEEKEDYLSISCVYPYLDPTLNYVDESFEDWKKGELKKDRILHELCHILTDPLYSKAIYRYVGIDEIKDERERLTDTISSIIRNLIEK